MKLYFLGTAPGRPMEALADADRRLPFRMLDTADGDVWEI